ncbi:MAG TPA: acyl-CoA synthetase [Acidimicrobiales bacterium]|nr:acyl-CoA synthetase [Acidimicrobiales bacterium]
MSTPGNGTSTQFNLPDVFDVVAGVHPDRPCLVWGDRRWTFAEMADRSRRLAAYLQSRGLGSVADRAGLAGHESGQDHLGSYLYNGNEYLESMLGAWRARVAPFNVNYRYVADELVYLLDNADCRALVYHERFAPTLAGILDRLPRLEVLLQVADGWGHDLLPGAVDYEAALAGADTGPLAEVRPEADDLYVLYTGGTTGMPKGVLWREHDIYLSAMGGRNILTQETVDDYEAVATMARAFAEPLRFMILPPLMHGAAQWVSFIALNSGHTVVLPPDTTRLDPAQTWRTIERERCTTLTVVGDAMARPLVEELEAGEYDMSSLLSVGNGGAPLTPTIKQRLLACLPHILLTDSVGSSETGAQMSHLSSAGGEVSTGRFAPGPGTVVVSEELDKVLEPGHDGIGWLAQQGWVPLGYYKDEAKTAATFPVIGGVRYSVPGDRARHLAGGEIELLGRDSVTINSGGEKIFAEEVERAIAGHPAVHDVVVVGRPSERWGQEVVALVELTPGMKATAESIVGHAADHVARYKLPKDVLFLDAIQRSPAGKADYRWARAQVE